VSAGASLGSSIRARLYARGVADDPDFHRLARTQETMLRLWRDGDEASALVIWDGLDEQEQRNVFGALAAMVNHLRAERGDDPDDTYGPPETEGL
jgi:hypothetical protein